MVLAHNLSVGSMVGSVMPMYFAGKLVTALPSGSRARHPENRAGTDGDEPRSGAGRRNKIPVTRAASETMSHSQRMGLFLFTETIEHPPMLHGWSRSCDLLGGTLCRVQPPPRRSPGSGAGGRNRDQLAGQGRGHI